MDVKSYNKICNIFNKIIHDSKNDQNILSIPILHVQRNHDAYLKDYIDIINKNNYLKFLIITSVKCLICFFWRNLEIFLFEKKNIRINKTNKKVLILSHLFEDSQEKYFKHMNLKSLNYQMIYINHGNKADLIKNKIIISERLNFINELKVFYAQLKLFSFFLKKFFFEKNLLKKKIYLLIISKIFHGSTSKIFRINKNIFKILDIYKPKYFLTTLEGFCHEKIIFSLKKQYPNCKMIGFQHNIIFDHYNSLLNNKNRNTFPHQILTVSRKNKKILEKKKIFLEKVINIGKIQYKSKKLNKSMDNEKITCIFSPEGIFSESIQLFNLAYKIAEKDKNINIILRLHPNLQHHHKKIINYNILNNHSNLKYSTKNLQDDLKKSQFGVYRGSHSVFDFINHNICPIFFSSKKLISEEDKNINLIKVLEKNFYFKANNENQLLKILKKKISQDKIKINNINYNNIFDKFDEKKFKIIFNEKKN